MAPIVNRKKVRLDKDGNAQRVKYKGSLPLSIGYGVYLGDSFDEKSDSSKAFFLMSGISSDGSTLHAPQILSNPVWSAIPLDEFPFSKKFTTCDEIINSLKPGTQYWFAYTSEAASFINEGRPVIYENLNLLIVDDDPGFEGIKGILSHYGIVKSSQNT
jgi:hypothetical protein